MYMYVCVCVDTPSDQHFPAIPVAVWPHVDTCQHHYIGPTYSISGLCERHLKHIILIMGVVYPPTIDNIIVFHTGTYCNFQFFVALVFRPCCIHPILPLRFDVCSRIEEGVRYNERGSLVCCCMKDRNSYVRDFYVSFYYD